MKPATRLGTATDFVFRAIRPDYLAIAPTLGEQFSKYAFPDDLPAGAWLDAPEDMPAGSVYAGPEGRLYLSCAFRP